MKQLLALACLFISLCGMEKNTARTRSKALPGEVHHFCSLLLFANLPFPIAYTVLESSRKDPDFAEFFRSPIVISSLMEQLRLPKSLEQEHSFAIRALLGLSLNKESLSYREKAVFLEIWFFLTTNDSGFFERARHFYLYATDDKSVELLEISSAFLRKADVSNFIFFVTNLLASLSIEQRAECQRICRQVQIAHPTVPPHLWEDILPSRKIPYLRYGTVRYEILQAFAGKEPGAVLSSQSGLDGFPALLRHYPHQEPLFRAVLDNNVPAITMHLELVEHPSSALYALAALFTTLSLDEPLTEKLLEKALKAELVSVMTPTEIADAIAVTITVICLSLNNDSIALVQIWLKTGLQLERLNEFAESSKFLESGLLNVFKKIFSTTNSQALDAILSLLTAYQYIDASDSAVIKRVCTASSDNCQIFFDFCKRFPHKKWIFLILLNGLVIRRDLPSLKLLSLLLPIKKSMILYQNELLETLELAPDESIKSFLKAFTPQ